MSFLEDLINEMDKAKQPKEQTQAQDKLSKFYEFEKNLRELAKSKGVQPRTFLEQLVATNPELAKNKIIQKLLGEQDVPTQKGRDAKRDVLKPKAMNTVKQGIKQAAKKQRRRMDKDAVDEQSFVKGMKTGSPGDTMSSQDKMKMLQAIKQKRIQHAKMSPGPAKDKLSGEILDMMANAKMLIDPMTKKVMQSVEEGRVKDMMLDMEADATEMSKEEFIKAHGERYGYIWDRVNDPNYQDIGDLMDGNEFAKKVTDLKAQGAKPGTKFKTSDGQEHTLEDLVEKMMLVRDQVAKAVADKVQDWAKGASIDQINKVLAMIKSGAKLKPEGPQSASMQEDVMNIEEQRRIANAVFTAMELATQLDVDYNSDTVGEFAEDLVTAVEQQTEEQFEQLAEKKDACYHKVKSRYKVWPSAYASGALVRCRKVGAKNWGNKSKK
mgnify:CR=1 FL=1